MVDPPNATNIGSVANREIGEKFNGFLSRPRLENPSKIGDSCLQNKEIKPFNTFKKRYLRQNPILST